jgi:predicted anti-sigma-YlaC factor YlaD
VNCRMVDGVLDEAARKAEIAGEVRRHLDQCPRCRKLYGWMSSGLADGEVFSPPAARIGRALAAGLLPVRRLPPARTITGRLLLVLAMLAAILTGIMGTAGWQRMNLAQIVSMSVALITGAVLLSASLSRQMRPGSYYRLPAAMAVAVFGIGVLTGISLFFPWHQATAFLAHGWPCLVAGMVMAAIAAVLLWLVVRRGAPLSIPTLGATLGAMAGLLALTVLQLQCPYQQAPHLLVFHGGALALSTLAGWLIASAAVRLAR